MNTKQLQALEQLKCYAASGIPPNVLDKLFDTKDANQIKNEVDRLGQVCSLDADTSDFAKLKVKAMLLGSIKFTLDKISKKILTEEIKKYSNKYTQGVYEVVMCSKRYSRELTVAKRHKLKGLYEVPLMVPCAQHSTSNKQQTPFNLTDFFYQTTLSKTSTFFPVFCKMEDNILTPVYSIDTQINELSKDAVALTGNSFFDKYLWQTISADLTKKDKILIFKFVTLINKKERVYFATSTQLEDNNDTATFIKYGAAHGRLSAFEVYLYEHDSKKIGALSSTYKLKRSQKPGLITHTVHIKSVTEHLSYFSFNDIARQKINNLKRYMFTLSSCYKVKSLRKEQDRRENERYAYETKAKIRTSFRDKQNATLIDISTMGAKIRLNKRPSNILSHLRLDIPLLGSKYMKLFGVKYKVVEYMPKTLEVRLQIDAKAKRKEKLLSLLIKKNIKLLSPYSSSAIQSLHFHFFSELSLVGMPGEFVFCNKSHSLSESMIKGFSGNTDPDNKHLKTKNEKYQLGHILVDNKENTIGTNLYEDINLRRPHQNTVWHKTNAKGALNYFIGDKKRILEKNINPILLSAENLRVTHINYIPITNSLTSYMLSFLSKKNIKVNEKLIQSLNINQNGLGLLQLSSVSHLYRVIALAAGKLIKDNNLLALKKAS